MYPGDRFGPEKARAQILNGWEEFGPTVHSLRLLSLPTQKSSEPKSQQMNKH